MSYRIKIIFTNTNFEKKNSFGYPVVLFHTFSSNNDMIHTVKKEHGLDEGDFCMECPDQPIDNENLDWMTEILGVQGGLMQTTSDFW